LEIIATLNICNESYVNDNGIENKIAQYSNPLTLCSIEYCFTLAWKYVQIKLLILKLFLYYNSFLFIYFVRLLLSLPIPIQKIQGMIKEKYCGIDSSNLLYFLIWGPRTGSKIYYHFLKVNIKL